MKQVRFLKNRKSLRGSRKQVCSMQRQAAKLGLLANKSLIRAFEIEEPIHH